MALVLRNSWAKIDLTGFIQMILSASGMSGPHSLNSPARLSRVRLVDDIKMAHGCGLNEFSTTYSTTQAWKPSSSISETSLTKSKPRKRYATARSNFEAYLKRRTV